MAYRVKDRWYGDYRGGRKQDAASRDFGCPPSDRRLQLQHPGEKDMFKIVG